MYNKKDRFGYKIHHPIRDKVSNPKTILKELRKELKKEAKDKRDQPEMDYS